MKLKNFRVRIGTKDPNSNKYIGADSVWEKATNAIKDAVKQKNIPFEVAQGEAAFYGPKADILVKDSLDREWQTGTIQVDYNLPERFQLDYIGSDGLKHRPIMIHRAALGSFERFTGIVIEHFGGAFPLWLAPEQVRIITISDNFADYGRQVFETLMDNEIRAKLDDRNETLGYKIREAQKQKVPYVLVVGAKEKETGNVAVRPRQGAQEVMPLQKFVEKALKEIKNKA
jgi:threonyl-tRNA synthetase